MESFLNRRYQKKQAEQQKATAGPSNEEGQKIELGQHEKKNPMSRVKESDRASSFSSTASTLKPKEKIPLQHTRKGRFLDTAAAFVGLPHICSDE